MARLPEGALMRRAATGLATVCAGLLRRVYGSHVTLLVGGGNNGGDVLYAGAILARRGARVTAVLAAPKVHPDGLAAFQAAGGRLHEAPLPPGTDLVIDGLTGIGGQGALRGAYAALAEAIPAGVTVVACDVPSGVDADTGAVAGVAVRADVTVTFGTHKPGLLVDPGASHAGVVELIDLGLRLPEAEVVAMGSADVRVPQPGGESDKYRRGVVGILAGGADYSGAAVLSVGGALHAGVGMVRFASSEPVVQLVRQRWPEAVTTVLADPPELDFGRVQAWVAGPGLGTDERAVSLVSQALASELPVLVDADGLTVLAAHRDLLARAAPTVLTPHAGELARLLDADRAEIEAHRLDFVRRASAELGVTVLLKGSTTLVASPDGPVHANPTGTPWLATAGTGDVLSGLIGALLATGIPAPEAAASGAYLHGLAARLAAPPITPVDVIGALSSAFRAIFSATRR